jgi:hypothetical protein
VAYVHNGVLLSFKRGKVLSFEVEWINPEDIMLSKIKVRHRMTGAYIISLAYKPKELNS